MAEGWIGRLCALCALAGLAELALPEGGARRAARLAIALLLTAQLVGALAALIPALSGWSADAALREAVVLSDVNAGGAGAEAQLLSLGRQACARAIALAEDLGFERVGAQAEMSRGGRVVRLTVQVARSDPLKAVCGVDELRAHVASAMGLAEGSVVVEVLAGEGGADGGE